MAFRKLETTDAFVVTDFDDAPTSVGIVRLAPKILRDGAELLARSVTYTFAFFELQLGGASAGINCAKPEDRDAAITAFMEELVPDFADRRLVLFPGTGVTEADLRALATEAPKPEQTAASALAAATSLVGSLSGKAAAIVGSGPVVDAARAAAAEAGADTGDNLDDAVDVVFVAGKSGVVDHEAAAGVKAPVLVPLTPLAVTAKAYAALSRAGTVYVPDFVALAGPLLDRFGGPSAAEATTRVAEATAELKPAGVDMWRDAVDRAETFLRSWRTDLPFGRPLA